MASPASRPSASSLDESTSRAILRALPAHVALVDARGTVVEVNEAWTRFARDNGWNDPRAGVGTSYLAACDGATGGAAADGAAVAAGLRAVLQGSQSRFEYEYACPSPDAARWFRLSATPTDGPSSGAVVMHVDITERRLFEDALRENAGLLRNAQRMAGLGYFHMDLPTGRLALASETCAMLGCDPSDCIATWEQFIAQVDRREQLRLAADVQALASSRGTLDTQVRFFRADGSMRWLRIRAEAISPASARHRIAGTLMDITERRAAGETLRASEERYRLLSDRLRDTLENMPDGFFTLDRAWRVTYLNRASEMLAGPREAFTGRVLWELFPEEEAMFRPEYQRALDEQRPVEFEAWSPRLALWLELRAYPTREGLGVYFRDVTERRRIQEELRASEERFGRVAEVTTDAIWDWDIASGTVWRSHGMGRLFGVHVPGGGADRELWIDRIHPEDRERVLGDVRRTLATRDAHWSGEYRFRRADGTYAWASDRAFIIRDAAGQAIRMVGGMSDVTEQRRSRELLEEQARLLDHARDAIHVRDLQHRVQYLNRSAEQLFGWSAQDALGRSIQTLLQRDPEAFERANARLLADGEWIGELPTTTRDGRHLTVEARWTLLRDAQGIARRILAIDTDVTERRQLEQQVIRSQRLDSIGTLAGGIAHDLNNVFTPILMAVNLLDPRERSGEDAGLLEAIRTSARRGVDMVGQLLSFARGADGARSPVRPGEIVSGVLAIVGETFPKDVVVESEVAPRLPAIRGNATQLHQVLLNLCVNARDAMPAGGRLTLRARLAREPLDASARSCVAFDVEDTGSGIAPEDLEKLWDPFFTTKAPGHGTGLGLPTSLAIVKGHGGQIRVETQPGHGSRFTVVLPADEGAAMPSESRPPEPAPSGAGRRVLVVDDEEAIRKLARRALESHGYAVAEAADGAQAVAACARDGAIDLVLLDMVMPVMDGAQAMAELRAIDPRLPIVATTGYASAEHLARVSAAGVPFLPKPYTPEALLRAVGGALAP